MNASTLWGKKNPKCEQWLCVLLRFGLLISVITPQCVITHDILLRLDTEGSNGFGLALCRDRRGDTCRRLFSSPEPGSDNGWHFVCMCVLCCSYCVCIWVLTVFGTSGVGGGGVDSGCSQYRIAPDKAAARLKTTTGHFKLGSGGIAP